MNIKKLFALGLVYAALAVGTAPFPVAASTFTFADSYVAWPGYPRTIPQDGNRATEAWGDPELASMVVTLDNTNRYITSVTLNLNNTGIIRFDSLFINTSYVKLPSDGSSNKSWDQSWEYLVHTGGSQVDYGSSANISGNYKIDDGFYKVVSSLTDPYKYTTVKTGARDGHPDGIDSTDLQSIDKSIKGVYSASSLTITYNFATLFGGTGIPIIDGFTIGYTPWCANDVFLASAPVPEPATLLLFGSGMLGLAGLRFRRKAQAN